MGKCGAGIVFAQQGKRAPDHGGTGVDRETYPRSLVGSGVYDSRVVPVVGAVGSDLGGGGLVGLGRVAITRLITRPMRSRYQRAASWRAGRQRKEQSGSPGPRLNEESPSWQKLALTACLGRKHRKARACAPTPWWRKVDSNRRSLPVNELVSQAGMRMRARRQGWSRTRRPCSGDHGFESAFLQR